MEPMDFAVKNMLAIANKQAKVKGVAIDLLRQDITKAKLDTNTKLGILLNLSMDDTHRRVEVAQQILDLQQNVHQMSNKIQALIE